MQEFNYQDLNNDGVWEAQIQTPAVDGKYEIRTVIDNTETLSMIMVVDPEGYIYEKTTDNREIRISNAKVSIYWQDPKTNEFVLWTAKDFLQDNPQITDNTGKYSFLVPPGKYYLEVQSSDYITYKSQVFEVIEGLGVHQNIELKYKNWFWRIFTVERILMGFIALLLIVVIIILIYFLKIKTHKK